MGKKKSWTVFWSVKFQWFLNLDSLHIWNCLLTDFLKSYSTNIFFFTISETWFHFLKNSISLQFLQFFFTFSLAFISLQFLKLAFISLWFLFLYNSNATHLPKILVCVNIGIFWCYFLIISSSQCNWYNWMIHRIKEFFCNIIFADWVFKCQIKVIILIHFFPTIAFFRSWTLQWPTFSIYININMFL